MAQVGSQAGLLAENAAKFDMAADILNGTPLKRASFCRTFSDCTTGPRLGLVSGCYPLDKFYAARAEAIEICKLRTQARGT